MIKINVYKADGEWFGARWLDGDYDGCDELDVAGDAPEADALSHAMLMPLAGRPDDEPREINRVADVDDRQMMIERTHDQWWTWHDSDAANWSPGDDSEAATRDAERRCEAWVSGQSNDGPEAVTAAQQSGLQQ